MPNQPISISAMLNDDHPIEAASENVLWKATPSQWIHFWFYLLTLLVAAGVMVGAIFTGGWLAIALVVPAAMWGIRWWATRCLSYELTTQRLRIRSGILNRHLDELELYRVKDYSMAQPFFLRILGLGNLTLITSDATSPTIKIKAVRDVEGLREKLRDVVQSERDRKRVREMDVPGDDGAFS